MTRPELRPLTSIRGIFAWVVVFYHIRFACSGWLSADIVDALGKGYLAVDFFFLLSGFVIWLNYGERLRRRGGAGDFLVRRIARIWPLHAVMLGFALVLAIVLLVTGRPAPRFPLAVLPLHLLLVQDWGFADPLLWNDPAWSISCEWAAYLLTPIVARLVPARRGSTATLLCTAALLLLLLHDWLRADGAATLGAHIARNGLPRAIAEFGCGAVLSGLWRRWRHDMLAEASCWLAGGAALIGWAMGLPETLAVPLAFASLLLALALGSERPRHLLGGRAIHFLGEISYATYLSHFLLFFAFKLAFVRDVTNVPPALIAAYLLLVLVASAGLYLGIERPAQRALLRGWAGLRDRRAPVAAA